jgi:membrane protein DedA with SNARE-associated domain
MHLIGLLNFTEFISSAGYVAIFVLSVLQSCCVPTSSELTMGFAGVLAAEGKLSLPGVIVAGVLGEVVGAYIAWAVGRYAGRAAVDRYGRYILVTHHDLDRVEAWYDRHQRFGVFGSRLLPVIRNFVALPAGIAEVPLGRFGVLTAAGSLLWDGAWALIGYTVGSHWHAIASAFGAIGYVLGVVALGVVAFGVYHRYRSYKEATAGSQGPWMATASDPSGPDPAGPTGSYPRSPIDPDPGTVGTRRLVASSSGRPVGAPSPDSPASSTRRLVASSSGKSVASAGRPVSAPRARHSDFPNSSVAAWEAAVRHDSLQTGADDEPLLEEEGEGVEANGRLTAMLGALLLVLLAIEGVTLLRIHSLLTPHVVIGMVLVPVVVFKIGTAVWRFGQYYLGSPEYRRKGPPPALLRLLGPFVVVLTVAVVGSGIALLLAPTSFRNQLLFIHKATFVLWFGAMAIHVLGHLLDVAKLAPRDFYWRTRNQVRGASMRQWTIVGAVGLGIILAVAVAPKIGPWLEQGLPAHKAVTTNTATTSPASAPPATSTPPG